MPTYVYECDACGKQFEHFQSFKDAPLTRCISCAREGSVRRVFQPVGIVFKGSGWYITDSRGSSSSTLGDTSSNGEKKTAKAEKSDKAASSDTTSSE